MVPDTEPSINVICQYCCCSYCQSEPAAGAGWCLGAGGGGGRWATQRNVAGQMVQRRNTLPNP